MINSLRTSFGEWKTHLTMKTKFISSKDSDEKYLTNSDSENVEIMIGNNTNEIIKDIF